MRKIVSLLLILNILLVLLNSSVFAQESVFKDNATTIVGSGSGDPSNRPLPDPPPMDKFMEWFNIYSCQGIANTGSPQNCTKQNKDSDLAKIAYKRLSDPLRSGTYVNLLKVKQKPINIQFGTVFMPGCTFSGGGHWGRGMNNDDIRLDGYTTPGCPEQERKWSTIHESAHIIQERSPELYESFKVNDLADKDGRTPSESDCYEEGSDGPYVQTYKYRSSAIGGGAKAESFAEATGMNVVCGPQERCEKSETDRQAADPITNYPRICSHTYDWIKENVYGGVDFFGLGGATDISGFVYYCQGDPRWDDNKPLNECSLKSNGCGPTSIAMVLSTLGGNRITPPEVVTGLISAGLTKNNVGCTGGTNLTNVIYDTNFFENRGFKTSSNLVNGNRLDLASARNWIDKPGGPWIIIATVQDFPCVEGETRCADGHTTTSHIFVITDVNPGNGTVTIRDPMGCNYSGNETRYDRTRPANFANEWSSAYAIHKKP